MTKTAGLNANMGSQVPCRPGKSVGVSLEHITALRMRDIIHKPGESFDKVPRKVKR